MDPRLLDLVDEKIEHLKRYNEITSRIIYEDIDGVGELIEKRQEIITAVDGISLEMKQLVSEQSMERQDTLNRILCFEEISGLTGSLKELQEKISETSRLYSVIKKNDKIAVERLKDMRDEVYSQLTKSAQGKRVVNYFGATAMDIRKGSKLNASH
ncbi:MAG: hypothetical protein ACI4JJ_00465 [Huintestinicola sp.]